MAVLFPQLQFFDNNGNPLSLGKVYTYITGTTTPKSTWTTAAESANHPNPVILDDEGRAEIWLSTDSEYRITIKSATDATIQGPIDNVTGVGIQLSAYGQLASDLDVNNYAIVSTGNGDITLSPNGTGDVIITNDTLKIDGTATKPARVILGEDTDSGSNTVTIAAPSTIASDKVQTLQDVTGTIYVSTGTDIPVTDGGTGASDAATARTNLGLSSADTVSFSAIELGHASDTTISRASAGDINVEGNIIYRAGGTDVPITDGGTGQSSASAGFNALSPITTTGDMIYSASGATNSRLALGSRNQAIIAGASTPAYTSTLVHHATVSGTTVGDLEHTFNTTNVAAIKVIINVTCSDASAALRLEMGNGSSYAFSRNSVGSITDSSAVSTSGLITLWDLAAGETIGGAGATLLGDITLFKDPANSYTWRMFGQTAIGLKVICLAGSGFDSGSATITRFKLEPSAGTITGSMYVYQYGA